MSNIAYAGLGVLVLLLLLVMGMNIGTCMMAIGFFGVWLIRGFGSALTTLYNIPFTQSTNYSFAVIPLFVLMGNLAFHSGMSTDLYYCFHRLFKGFRGGLAITTIAACALFSAICGSSAATAATMGVVALPEMRRYDYDDGLSCGSIAAGGTLGILIPPSTCFIIYGIVSGASIGELFAAGIVPGIVLALCYIAAIIVVVHIWPDKAPKAKITSEKHPEAIIGALAMCALFFLAIGGIFLGWFSAVEASAVGSTAAFVYLIARGRFTWKNFMSAMRDTVKTSGMIFLILIGAYVFGVFLTVTGLPNFLANLVTNLNVNRWVVVIIILVIYAIMGCFMDSLAMVTLTVPIFLPIMLELGFDEIWYGVVMVMVMELGLMTPPVGMNVYIVAGVAKDVPLQKIFAGVVPMVIGMFVAIVLICCFPQLAHWLPGLLGY